VNECARRMMSIVSTDGTPWPPGHALMQLPQLMHRFSSTLIIVSSV
jgi:hypothetical protein